MINSGLLAAIAGQEKKSSLVALAWIKTAPIITTESTVFHPKDGAVRWTRSARSVQSLTGEAHLQFKVSRKAAMVFGLSSDPAKNSRYDSIDIALYSPALVCHAYSNGKLLGTFGAVNTATVFKLDYVGDKITVRINSAIVYSMTVGFGKTYWIDSSFHQTDCGFVDIKFSGSPIL